MVSECKLLGVNAMWSRVYGSRFWDDCESEQWEFCDTHQQWELIQVYHAGQWNKYEGVCAVNDGSWDGYKWYAVTLQLEGDESGDILRQFGSEQRRTYLLNQVWYPCVVVEKPSEPNPPNE